MDVGRTFVEGFIRTLGEGLGQKLHNLETLLVESASNNATGNTKSSGNAFDLNELDGNVLEFVWEEFPRNCSFFANGLREWISFPDGLLQEIYLAIIEWGNYPFSVQTKYAGQRKVRDTGLVLICEYVWSRATADILLHLMRYGSGRGRKLLLNLDIVHGLALKHLQNIELCYQNLAVAQTSSSSSSSKGNCSAMEINSPWRELISRLRGQAQIQWAAFIGELCLRNPVFVTRMLNDEIPYRAWQFVDISMVQPQIAREILNRLAQQFGQTKQDKAARLSKLLILDTFFEKINFRALGERDKQWEALFKEVVVPKFYKTAETLAKTDDLKAASLTFMLTILIRSPKSHFESSYQNFLNKRVLKHMVEPRKVTHSLEILLRSLRGDLFGRPVLAWDGFETYCPKVRFLHSPSPYLRVTRLDRKALEALFVDVFEKPKSKALAVLQGSHAFSGTGPGIINAEGNPVSVTASGVMAGLGNGSGSIGRSGNLAYLNGQRSSISTISSTTTVSSASSGGASLNNVIAASTSLNFRGHLSLPKNLRLSMHILLQIGAHDIQLLADRIIPFLLQMPDDVTKYPPLLSNRTIVGTRVLWEIFGPGYSCFRSTANSLSQVRTNESKLESILKGGVDKQIQSLIKALDKNFGTEAMGQADLPLVPTIFFAISSAAASSGSTIASSASNSGNSGGGSGKTGLSSSSTPTSGNSGDQGVQSSLESRYLIEDIVGDRLGYPFAWHDPDRSTQDVRMSTFTSDGEILELLLLVMRHEMFDPSSELGAFRCRNMKDKCAAQIQIQHSARNRQAISKKRNNHVLDLFRELLYCLPILSCSPVLTDYDVTPRLPPLSLLLHMDWNIASATSHCLQRIIACTRSNKVRMQIFTELLNAIKDAVRPSPGSVRVVLTYMRQLLLLLRLFIFICGKSPSMMESEWANRFLEVALALLAYPCATIRGHAVEVIECVRILLPQSLQCETILSILTNHKLSQYRCALDGDCACGLVDASGTTMASSSSSSSASLSASSIHENGGGGSGSNRRRNKTVDDSRFIRGERNGSMPSITLSSHQGRSSSTPDGGVGAVDSMLHGKGSSEPFTYVFSFINAPDAGRDELFLWYSTNADFAQIMEDTIKSDGKNPSRIDSLWRTELVSIAHRLVDCGTVSQLLFSANGLLLSWLPRLPPFAIEAIGFHVSLRKTICSFALALSGCDPNICATSPHSITPGDPKWPGQLEPAIEKLVNDLWDSAEGIQPTSQSKALLRHSLEEMVGQSSHTRCIGRFVELLLNWRYNRVTALQREAQKNASMDSQQSNEKGSKFVNFLRRGASHATMVNKDGSFVDKDGVMDVRSQIVCVEKANACVLRLLLGRYPSIPGWERALKKSFLLIAQLTKTDLLQEGDWTVSLEFTKLVLQCTRCLSHELKYLDDLGKVFERADVVWPRADRRRVWKLMRRLAGFDDLTLFSSSDNQSSISSTSSASPISPMISPTGLIPIDGLQSSATSPSPKGPMPTLIVGDSKSGTHQQKVLADGDFNRLRELTTRTATEMLKIGPSSLGAVASRPDEMLWNWLYHDETGKRDGTVNATERRLLSCYLAAHWHVGDVEAAGGGTFGPFMDRWYQEDPGTHADAIFHGLCDAVQLWLFRGPNKLFVRPIEPTAIAPLAFLGLLQFRTHPDPIGRSRALQLLDAIERSTSKSSSRLLQNFDFHRGSDLGVLTFCNDPKLVDDNARRASLLLAECCPELAAQLMSEACERLPSLVAKRPETATGCIEMLLAWCTSPQTSVTPIDKLNLDRDISHHQPHKSTSSPSVDSIKRKTKEMVSLEEIWTCCLKLATKILLFLPLWRSLCDQHAATVVDFILSKLITNDGKQLEIASFLLSSVTLSIFHASPSTILNRYVISVLYAVDPRQVIRGLFTNSNIGSFKSTASGTSPPSALEYPKPLQNWIQMVIDATPFTSQDNDVDLPAQDKILLVQRHVLAALNLCLGAERRTAAPALPQMIALSVCATNGATKSAHVRSPEHQCLSSILHSIMHERLYTREGNLKHISNDKLGDLARVPPECYSEEQLYQVLDAAHEMLTYCDPSGHHLLGLCCQSLLYNCFAHYYGQMIRSDAMVLRFLMVYQKLRSFMKTGLTLHYGTKVLGEEVSLNIETLAFMKILHQSLNCGSVEVSRFTCLSILRLDPRFAGERTTKILLSAYAYTEDLGVESLLLQLLTRLRVEQISWLDIAEPLMLKLQRRITNHLRKHKSSKPIPTLNLFTRLQYTKTRDMESYLATLLPFILCKHEAFNILVDNILSLDNTILAPQTKDAMTAYAGCMENQSLMDDVIVSIVKQFDGKKLSECFVNQIFTNMDDSQYLGATLEWCATILDKCPECAIALDEIIRIAASPTPALSHPSLAHTWKRVTASAYRASIHPSNCPSSAAGKMGTANKSTFQSRSDRTSSLAQFQVLDYMRKLVEEESTHVSKSLMSSLGVMKEQDNLDSLDDGEQGHAVDSGGDGSGDNTMKRFVKELKLTVSQPKMGLAKTESGLNTTPLSTTSGTSIHQLSIVQQQQLEAESNQMDQETVEECFIGGVASFESSKVLDSITREDLQEARLEDEEEQMIMQPYHHHQQQQEQQGTLTSISSSTSSGTPTPLLSRSVSMSSNASSLGVGDGYPIPQDPSSSGRFGSAALNRFVSELLENPENRFHIEAFVHQDPSIERSWLDLALEVIEFRKKPSKQLAMAICKRFIALDSIDTVDLSDEDREEVIQKVNRLPTTNLMDSKLFDDVLLRTFEHLEDDFLGRFLRSIQYHENFIS